jgi:hypothetical protein
VIEYIPVILICNVLWSDAKCIESNPEVTVSKGKPQNTPIACIIEGSAVTSQLAFSPKLGDSYYVRIRCLARNTEGVR